MIETDCLIKRKSGFLLVGEGDGVPGGGGVYSEANVVRQPVSEFVVYCLCFVFCCCVFFFQNGVMVL